MQESRLFRIVYYLLDKGQATAPELAERFEVSVRTIYRDIDALSGAGIPVYAEQGRNGGIRLMNDFVLDRVVLSEEEKQEILTALQGIRTMQNIAGSRTLEKLSGMFQLSSENWFEVDFSRWGNEAPDNGKFERLRAAIVHCRKVRIRYAGSNGSMSVRNVEPHKLAYKANAWYLKAFCCIKQDWRVFKLNRILDLEMLDEDFEYRDIPEPAGGLRGEYPEITLRFSREAAYRVYDEFDAAQIKRQENGDLIVSERMPDDAWLIGFLLSLGTQVEVLSPGYLREILARRAEEIYEMNRSRM
ncbi:YafY family transcriptional regulator [bacterium 1XD8-76]|nr:YafY family transcriptional regulator [bacterium 1XD8-76]